MGAGPSSEVLAAATAMIGASDAVRTATHSAPPPGNFVVGGHAAHASRIPLGGGGGGGGLDAVGSTGAVAPVPSEDGRDDGTFGAPCTAMLVLLSCVASPT